MTPDPLLRGDAAARVVNLIRACAASGGRVFVDSGAFVEERLLDFEVDVYPVYERGLLSRCTLSGSQDCIQRTQQLIQFLAGGVVHKRKP